MSPLECSHGGAAKVMAQSVPVFAVPAWTSPTSSLAEIPRPVLTTGCSQESFVSFKRKWVSYVKYYERDGGGKKGDGEIQNQLFSCLDTVLQTTLLQYLDDINTEEYFFYIIQAFAVEKGETAGYNALGDEIYSTLPNKYETAAAVEIGESIKNTKIYEATAKEPEQHAFAAAMVEVEDDVKQSRIEPATGDISPRGGKGGQGGGATK